MPQAGKSVREGTVLRWRKRLGEAVQQGDVLLEVETDEGLVEVQSASPGTLAKILAQPGSGVAVDGLLAELSSDGAALVPAPAATPARQEAKVSNPATPAGPVTPIVMPKAGQSMEEGTLVKWHVKPGDRIKKGQVIFEIETDKATMDVEAVDEGRVAKIVVQDGGFSKVLEPVAYLAENDADVEAFAANANTTEASAASPAAEVEQPTPQASVPSPASSTSSGRVKASPAARKIAGERGIELPTVGLGSGPGGRILSTDVLNAVKSMPAQAGTPAKAPAPVTVAAFVAPPVTAEGVTRKRMSQMRKIIARNLLASKQTIPHFYLKQKIDAGPLYSFYQAEKAKYQVSLNDVIVAACGKALMEFPAFRSRIEGDEIITFPSANIGIAVGMDDGLVVPVVMTAEQRSLAQIGAESKRIAVNARGGKIEGMGNGVFTITNLGMFGTEEFLGIINPPEAAILAVGAVKEEVIVSGGTMRAGRVMTMVVSADHRVIDGMLAAKFMARLKEILEYPQQLA